MCHLLFGCVYLSVFLNVSIVLGVLVEKKKKKFNGSIIDREIPFYYLREMQSYLSLC